MRQYTAENLVIHPGVYADPEVIVEVTPADAGWDTIHFQARWLAAGRPELLTHAGTTRLAGSDPTMMADILFSNREAVLAQLDSMQAHLTRIASALRASDAVAVRHCGAPAPRRDQRPRNSGGRLAAKAARPSR